MRRDTITQPHGTSLLRALAPSIVFVAMLVTALALWTLIPLGWIWIGSKVSDTQFPAEVPYAVVAVGITISIVIDAWLLGRLNRVYVRLTHLSQFTSVRPNWLKSTRDSEVTGTTTAVEVALMASVLLAGAVFLAWFFFLAGSPLPKP